MSHQEAVRLWGGRRSAALVTAFLTGRSFQVAYRGSVYHTFKASSGVPQGSVLGPTPFNVYVCIPQSDRVLTVQSADDTTLAMGVRSAANFAILQAHLALWSTNNHLSLSHGKCAVMRFSSARNVDSPYYSLGGFTVPPVQVLNILGVSFTPTLDFRHHVARVVGKARSLLGFVSRFSQHFGRDALKTLYSALVLPQLEYCSSIWSPHQVQNMERLEGVQRCATRMLASRDLSMDYKARLRSIGWHRLSYHRTVSRVCLLAVACGPSLDGSYLATVTRISSRTGLHLPVFARTRQHEASLFPSTVGAYLSLPGHVRPPLPGSGDELRDFSLSVSRALAPYT